MKKIYALSLKSGNKWFRRKDADKYDFGSNVYNWICERYWLDDGIWDWAGG